MNVLIIDDDPGIRATLGTALETMGHQVETAVLAIQRGAFDYLAKPFKPAQIAQMLERVAKTRQRETRISDLEGQLARPGAEAELAATSDPAMQRLLEVAKKSASSDAPGEKPGAWRRLFD